MTSFSQQREELERQFHRSQPGAEALRVLSLLRGDFDWSIPGYRNSLSILSDTSYKDRRHFLLELIQNADDAQFGESKAELRFEIHDTGLELAYNEEGFTAADVLAITDTGQSTKKGQDISSHKFIGEKGIGFKSVFALADYVEIISHPWYFRLDADACIVPKLMDPPTGPTPEGTRIRLSFSDSRTTGIVADELHRLLRKRMESFLFLQRIARFVLIDRRGSNATEDVIDISPGSRDSDKLAVYCSHQRRENGYAVYSQDFSFDASLVKSRWDKDIGPIKRRFSVAMDLSHPAGFGGQGLLFCYLPTEEVLPVPIFLHVDAQTTADRGHLLNPEANLHPWNHKVFSILPGFLSDALLHWRFDDEVRDRIPDAIPLRKSEGQLSSVFESLKSTMRDRPWIKVMDVAGHDWAKPGEVVRLPRIWSMYFSSFPDELARAQVATGVRFMHPDWAEKWDEHWREYRIAHLDAERMAAFLPKLKWHQSFRDTKEHITEIYKDIAGKIVNAGDSEKKLLVAAARRAAMFPFRTEDEGKRKVQPIDLETRREVYWLGTKSMRDTGMESLSDLAIIHPSYTRSQSTRDIADEDKLADIEASNLRNEALRVLLHRLGAKELNDDNITDIQVTRLLSGSGSAGARRRILKAMYEVYSAKLDYLEAYLQQLHRVNEALFPATDGAIMPLAELTLPRALRAGDGCHLFYTARFPELDMADVVSFDSMDARQRNVWRDFLTACGIIVGPRFVFTRKEFATALDFKRADEKRFSRWRGRILNDYSSNNSVRLTRVRLDNVSLELAATEGRLDASFWQALYQAWLKEHAPLANRISSVDYKPDCPPPGYYQVTYRRRKSNSSPIMPDSDWAGLERGDVRLQTLDGRLEPASKCRWVTSGAVSLAVASRYIALVEVGDAPSAYRKEFLASLEVPALSAQHVSGLFDQVPELPRERIAEVALELANFGISMASLQLYDSTSKVLRPVTEFYLGETAELRPMIAIQYGPAGAALGEHLKLPRLDAAEKYRAMFELILSKATSGDAQSELAAFLLGWVKMSLEEREKCKNALSEVTEGLPATYLVVNQPQLSEALRAADALALCLSVKEKQIHQIRIAARECGFLLPDETGEVVLSEASELTTTEKEEVQVLLAGYVASECDDEEQAQISSMLSVLGGIDGVAGRVVKAAAAYRSHGNSIEVPIGLPFIDAVRGSLVVHLAGQPVRIVADIFAAVGFMRMKIAEREVREFRGRMARASVSGRSPSAGQVAADPPGTTVRGADAEVIVRAVNEALSDDRPAVNGLPDTAWKSGISPDQEQELQSVLGPQLLRSLSRGEQAYEQSLRRQRTAPVPSKRYAVGDVHAKEFLLDQYDGRCQICATRLELSSGGKWIEVFRIVQPKESLWWASEPFNILGLCPNCHALARHGGGRDFTAIRSLVIDILGYSAAPREVPEHHGDFYVVPVTINGANRQLVMAALHMSYFIALNNVEQMA